MKFLVNFEGTESAVSANPREYAMMIESILIPSLQAIEKLEREGKVVGGVYAGERAGALIMEAANPEELSRSLARLPFWGVVDMNVSPIQSFSSSIEQTKEQLNSLKALAQARPVR